MSIFSKVESGTSWNRSRFTKSISYGIQYDAKFGQLIPVLRKFCLPGDVWRIGGLVLVRLQPMVSPPMNRMQFKIRYFFVPLRLIEPNAELIITGSKDGHLYNGVLPIMPNIFSLGTASGFDTIPKHSLMDYFGCQVGSYSGFTNDECLPAAYWTKAYFRCYWDYYDDENIGNMHTSYADFDAAMASKLIYGGLLNPEFVYLPKDYFTSSLPWQLKGVAPTITLGVGSVDFTNCFATGSPSPGWFASYTVATDNNYIVAGQSQDASSPPGYNFVTDDSGNTSLLNALNKAQVSLTGSLNADDIRTMFAQTRIFERLARSGSRYTEYLRANFGTAPADDTLQRAQYLGGWKLPIVTTEVLQTAADGSTPVGTMRGHGITNGGNRIHTFHCKEFGIILGLAHVLPEIKYSTGCPREMSYKRRFDFFNPSFQHLSEQEVRNGELWIGSDNKNDDTFGFQAYANELRSSQNIVVGDMRSSLNYWNQALDYSSRPNLNHSFLYSGSYLADFNKCFAVSGASAFPLVIDFYNDLDVYRPMVRYATPGLVDHL